MAARRSLFVCGIAAMALVLGGCEDKLTSENFAKITRGMTQSQVEQILGPGELQDNSGMNISATGMAGVSSSKRTTYVWKSKGAEVSVSYEDGKVVSTSHAGL